MYLKLNYNSGEFLSEKEVVLQIPKDVKLWSIEAGLSNIPGKLIPFSTTHPKDGFRDKDPKTIFNQDNRFAGTIDSAWIDYTRWPQIRAKIDITDPEVKFLIRQEKVLISYAYWRYLSPAASFSFDVDHLLIYPRKGGA